MVAMDEQQEEKQQQDHHQSKPSSSSSSSFPSPSMGRREGRERESRERKEQDQEEEQMIKEKIAKAKLAKSHPTFLGRHRISAAILHLNNQINIIQAELNELETVGQSSIVCKELISSLETIPDPLLPTTEGPVDENWDRWFRGAHNSKGPKRWI